MDVSDMEKQEAPLAGPEMPGASAWLGVVGAAAAVLLVCFAWTVWT